MEENKTEKYTFGVDEKETLQAMATVEASVGQHIQKKSQRELAATKYYSKFVINTKNGPVTLNNVFITAERNKEGELSYHFRWLIKDKNGEQSIDENLAIDENGEIYVSKGLKDYLGDAQIDIKELMAENDDVKKGRLKGVSEKAEPEKMEKELEDEKKEKTPDEEKQKIEEDLKEQGEDLKISKYREIKDKHVAERMPDVFGDGTEYGVAFSNKLNRFVIISKVNGKYQINENVEPARMTWKSIISIDPNGESVERKVPHALMKTNRSDKEIAVTIGQYGEVDIETVDVLPCQERVTRSVEMVNEGPKGQEKKHVKDTFNQEGGALLSHEIAHKKEILEREYGVTETNLEELKDLDIEVLMEEEADRVKISKAGFKSYVKNATGKTLNEKISNAQEEIVQEYMGHGRPRSN